MQVTYTFEFEGTRYEARASDDSIVVYDEDGLEVYDPEVQVAAYVDYVSARLEQQFHEEKEGA